MKVVVFNTNWADEMDITGYLLLKNEKDIIKWERIKELVKTMFKKYGETEIHFGTNEYNPCDQYQDWVDDLTEIEIDHHEIKVLEKMVKIQHNKYESQIYGIFPIPHMYSSDELVEQETELKNSIEEELYKLCISFGKYSYP
jgi:hypothetical protein